MLTFKLIIWKNSLAERDEHSGHVLNIFLKALLLWKGSKECSEAKKIQWKELKRQAEQIPVSLQGQQLNPDELELEFWWPCAC